eukprot:NODE_5286_length_518_cov_214.089552_g3916_i0.p1 GENE.NODE_5286_length_518_cov_214.089552_g3916_i0~~NODE_5286_length_518_cov_214.089552_g3916_i0.p1  ORF type:complete len:133 (+),score=32.49 NODE_5286_length_518_cov_214.089552_g3916_i0:106-504(+)
MATIKAEEEKPEPPNDGGEDSTRLLQSIPKLTLTELKDKKRALAEELNHLERQIYNLEGSYLEETMNNNYGNVLKGWDGYLQARVRAQTSASGQKRQKTTVKEADRLFSLSSHTYKQAVFGVAAASVDQLPL